MDLSQDTGVGDIRKPLNLAKSSKIVPYAQPIHFVSVINFRVSATLELIGLDGL